MTEVMIENNCDPANSLLKTNIEIPVSMLDELEIIAEELNIHPSAVITMMLRRSLDEHYLANRNRIA
ncbi:MAG: hypothetical protein WBM32_21580 [Crocosphaera sp.]